MGLARIGRHVVDDVLLVAALRHEDLHPVAGALGERQRQEFLFLDYLGEQRISRGHGLSS